MTSHSCMHRKLSRREFIKWGGLSSAALVLSACQLQMHPTLAPSPVVTPSAPPTPFPTSTKFIPTSTHPVPTAVPFSTVANARVLDYQPRHVRPALETMLDHLGGLQDIVHTGTRVGIKLNMTGSSQWDSPDKPPANEYFVTHPQVAGSMAELVKDLGASQVFFIDGIAEPACFEKWGYSEVARPLGVQLVNLCEPDPRVGFTPISVKGDPLVYDEFNLHPILQEVDVLISIAKLKVHSAAGVTLSMKNLIGLAAIDQYSQQPGDTFRSAFHGAYAFDTRLTRVILDLNRACPIQFSIIDGISTCEGGAGPWDPISQVHPGVLIAGRDPVAVDAVGTAVMGFNPQAESQTLPFTRCENYLQMARDLGMGENRLGQISIAGDPIESIRYPFRPV